MYRIICKSVKPFGTTPKPHISFFLGLQESSSSASNVKETISKSVNEDSFSVGYLMDEFGFTQEKAVLASSRRVKFQNRDKPDAVVCFFKNQGFTELQIRQIVWLNPCILNSKLEKTLLPKIQFFRSKGVSPTDLAKMVAFDPYVLDRSLAGVIGPAFQFFADFLGSDECVIHMLKKNVKVLSLTENRVKPNIEILSQAGVPYSNVAYLLRNNPHLFVVNPDKLKESITVFQKMRMDPNRCSYNLALMILTVNSRSKWNEKMEAYKRWGCSQDEVLTCFKILPWIMSLSIEKINGVMSFCVNEMGWQPSEVIRKYYVLTLSLNKRVVPRWSVYQELVSKRLVKEESNVSKLFTMKEDLFLERYVNFYKDEAPLLLKLYFDKLEASK